MRHVEEFVVKDTRFEGQDNSSTALELTETTAQIVNSTFLSNRKGSYRGCIEVFGPESGCLFKGLIGGAIIATNSTVDISRSRFEDNKADIGGAISAERDGIINMSGNMFVSNSASFGGGVLHSSSSTITIEASRFHDNNAFLGGVLASISSAITIKESEFHDNSASSGGIMASSSSAITIEASKFHNNSAIYWGGVLASISAIRIEASALQYYNAFVEDLLHSNSSTITIETMASKFYDNSAYNGEVLDSSSSNITIEASEFHDNNANYLGGVLYSSHSTITVEASKFYDNNATDSGGVLSARSSNMAIASSNFTNNVSPIGSIIHAISRSVIQHTYSYFLIDNNIADRYAVIYLSDSEFIGDDSGNATVTFSNNLGSLVAFNSNITFNGYATFVNNQPSQTVSGDLQEGGAMTLFQSNVFFDGECNLEHNYAENGGAIHSTESKLYVNGDVIIAHNTATGNGGGVYLLSSELNCQQESYFELYKNTAVSKGGGLHAIGSSIKAASSLLFKWPQYVYTGAIIDISRNAAERGGGISLEANAKLYILKYDYMMFYYNNDSNTTTFTANSADYGGAIHVDDDTNSGACASNTETECFIQVLALYSIEDQRLMTQSMYFSQNNANISGSTLYGGLLDRCTVSPFAEVHKKYSRDFKDRGDGIAYFKNVSTPTYHYVYNYSLEYPIYYMETVIDINLSVSSEPVRVCLCFNADQSNDCIDQYYTEVKKGQTFTLSVVAVDQVGQLVNATIQTSLHFTESGLAEGQLARKIPAKCTDLKFNVVSPHDSEILSLYAFDGPCKDAELSRATIKIHFLPCSCPIGLQVSEVNRTNCTCDCHSNISQYVHQCDSHTGLLLKQPQTRAWISYINDTDRTGYLVYPNCLFDYCLITNPPVYMYLNQPNGADTRCAFIGHLCCVDLANLVSASLSVVHVVSHVLATGLHYS